MLAAKLFMCLKHLQCFPSAIASHVVAEYPSKSSVSHRQGLSSTKAVQTSVLEDIHYPH